MEEFVLPDNISMEDVQDIFEDSSISAEKSAGGGASSPSKSGANLAKTKSSRAVSSVPSGSGMTFVVMEQNSTEDDSTADEGGGGGGDGNDPYAAMDPNRSRQIVAKTLKGARKSKGKGVGKKDSGKSHPQLSAEEAGDEPPQLTKEEEERQVNLERELTNKYLSGQLTFQEYVQQMDPDSEEEEMEEAEKQVKVKAGVAGAAVDADEDIDEFLDAADEEWKPPGTPKDGKKAKKAAVKQSPSTAATGSGGQGGEETEEMSKFAEELRQTSRQQLGKKRQRVGIAPRRNKLDPALQGLMGEANLRFVRGEVETAIRMCMEVIRQEPGVPEPFQTLSTLYEESGEHDRALQFALIAAHLAPQDSEEWARLADMSLEQNDIHQAITCYKKAIDANIKCVKYHWTRCGLLEQISEKTKALIGFKRLLNALDLDQGEEYFKGAREVARLYHEKGAFEEAKNAIDAAVKRYPNDVDPTDINLLLELLLLIPNYEDALEVVCQHCFAQFVAAVDVEDVDFANIGATDQLKMFASVTVPPETAAEIVAKLCITLIHLSAKHLSKSVEGHLLSEDAEEYGDLFLDVAEAYMTTKSFAEAVPYLERLVSTQAYGKAAVWLKYGECLYETGRLEEAETAYHNVVTLAPQHMEARRSLSNILNRLGRPDEALRTLSQDEEAELLNPTLLYEKCVLLFDEGRIDEFIPKAELLFSRHFVQIRNKEEMRAVAGLKRLNKKKMAINEVRQYRHEPVMDIKTGPAFESADIEVTPIKEFALFKRLCDVYFERKNYGSLQRITFSALGSPRFNKVEEIVKDCDVLCLVAAFLNGDSYHAYNMVRDMVVRDPSNRRLWNLFNVVISRADDLRHNRFLMRFMSRKPDSVALGVLNGHNCLVAGTYKYSLGEYMSAFKQDRDNPLIALMLGLTFTHMACQKFSARKHSLVVQACAFLNTYAHLRGYCQESSYNIGRAMHQLGILPAALHYYKQVLDADPVVDDDPNVYDLKKEAAHNIALIYKSSGSKELARIYLQKYVVI